MSERSFPHDTDTERAVLGSILLNRDALTPIAPWLASAAFYDERHAWIYEAMLACYGKRIPPDVRLVAAELKQRGQLDTVGGVGYLADLVDATPTSYHVEHYARLVARDAMKRAVIIAGGKIAGIGYDVDDEEQLVADAQAVLADATRRTEGGTLMPLSQIVAERMAALREGVAPGLTTGLQDYDQHTGGLHKSDLIIIAARPSVGKSSLALAIAADVAKRGHMPFVFSLEMSREQNLDRLAAMHGHLNLLDIRLAALSEADAATYMQCLGWADGLPIYIDDRPGITLTALRSSALRRQAETGAPAIIIVDYLQLMTAGGKGRSREQDVSEIARGLKHLAKEFNCPVLALAQLSRAVEGRTSHIPMLSDLRESGEIENAADQVVFIYREEMYDKQTDRRGIAELHIAKHRHGPLGVISVAFDATSTAFRDLAPQYRDVGGYDE